MVNTAQAGKKKTYDLNTQSDQFFGRYAGAPFPEAVEANEKELAEVIDYLIFYYIYNREIN